MSQANSSQLLTSSPVNPQRISVSHFVFDRWSCTVTHVLTHHYYTLYSTTPTSRCYCTLSSQPVLYFGMHSFVPTLQHELHSSAAHSYCAHTQHCDTLSNAHLLLHCCYLLLLPSSTMCSVYIVVVCHLCRALFADTRVCHLAHSICVPLSFSLKPADESLNAAVRAKTGSRHSAVTLQHCNNILCCCRAFVECTRDTVLLSLTSSTIHTLVILL